MRVWARHAHVPDLIRDLAPLGATAGVGRISMRRRGRAGGWRNKFRPTALGANHRGAHEGGEGRLAARPGQ